MKIAIVYDRFSLEKVANWVRQNENMLKNYEIYTDSRLTILINREIPKTRTVDLGETEDTNTIAALKCVEGKVDRVVHIIDMERNSGCLDECVAFSMAMFFDVPVAMNLATANLILAHDHARRVIQAILV